MPKTIIMDSNWA